MTGDWYYNKNNQQFGPVPFDQLKELAASGQLTPSDTVWRQGMGHWTRAGIVKGIFTAAAPAESPPADAPISTPTISPYDPGPAPPAAPYAATAPTYANPDQISANSARASRVLVGFPTPTGPREDWPLSPTHLAQLQQAEEHRKPIRTLAGLLRAFFLISIVTAVILLILALGVGSFGRRGGEAGIIMLIPAGVIAALSLLYYFAGRASTKCQSWGPIVMIVLMSLAILGNVLAAVGVTASKAEPVPHVLVSIIPIIILITSIKALGAMSRFLASPLWCQEALVGAKL